MLMTEDLSYRVHQSALIHQINLTFIPGKLYGILGPNGSGKSTLLKSMTGIWRPTQGRVLWHGQDLLKQERRQISKTISLVPQTASSYFDFSVRDTIAMGRYSHGGNYDSNILCKVMQDVDVWHLRDRPVAQLSSGERQRVFIARALVTESPVLVLDEPTSNLDVRHQQEIWRLLQKLLSPTKIIIVASHDLLALQRNCDEVAVMHGGRCVGVGAFDDIVNGHVLQEVFGITSF